MRLLARTTALTNGFSKTCRKIRLNPIPASLTCLTADLQSEAVRMFQDTMQYMGLYSLAITDERELAQALLQILKLVLVKPEMQEELYVQLHEQTRNNPDRDWQAEVELAIPVQLLPLWEKLKWDTNVLSRYKALLRQETLRMIRDLPYGGSTFYHVGRIKGLLGLLLERLLIGINKRGIHLFHALPKEYLCSSDFRDFVLWQQRSSCVLQDVSQGPAAQVPA
ncbi:hypothetical protein CLOP_g12877 [Closterium sp. NIES-67]|nr:hypothetical protein CLOP_g12877 [Closterium sp. NIES-67]